MKTKMNGRNEMKESVEQRHPEWVELVESHTGFDLDPTLTEVPNGSVRRLVVLATKLEEAKPEVLTTAEAEGLDGVVEGREATEAFLRNRSGVPVDVAGVRNEMLSGMAMATGVLAMATKVKVPEVAAEAAAVSNAVFGDGVKVSTMTPEEAVVEVEAVEKVLADEELSARLEVFVPAAVMAAVFGAKGRLKVALRAKGRKEGGLPIDRPMVTAFLRRRMRRYVRSVVASVNEEDLASVKRATEALQPIAWFREQSARLMAKAPAVEAEVAEVEEEDEAMPPVIPAGGATD